MNWNLEGLSIKGKYLDQFLVAGKVEVSRVKYGGGISHHVILETPIEVYGSMRERVIVDHEEILQVYS